MSVACGRSASCPETREMAGRLHHARVVLTGASGFVGSHLRAGLQDEGAHVWNVPHPQLSDMQALTETLHRIRPTHLFHLAGVLGGAPGGYAALFEANAMTTAHLLAAIVHSGCDPWVMVSSSSAVYGPMAPEEGPLSEERPPRPVTPYGVSQVARETVALQYHLAHGVRTVRVRTFNLIGPGQSASLLAADVTRQLAQAEHEGAEAIIRVGNLFPRRDYTDVRDAVRAYLLLAGSAQGGEVYNVCSGRSLSVQGCLDILSTVSPVPLRVVVEAERVRAVEVAEQVGDPARLHRVTGWAPVIPLAVSFQDLLAFWRSRLQVESRV